MTDRDHFAAAALTGLLARGLLQSNLLAADAYKVADAMLREREPANLDAAPEARASVESVAPQPTTRGDSDRTDKAAQRPSEGTGDTPATHATPAQGSVQRECTEPVAWAVCTPGDGDWSPCFFHEPHAQRCASAILGSKNIVPLYRSPTLTDAEREAVAWAEDCADSQREWKIAATLRGLLERLGGGR